MPNTYTQIHIHFVFAVKNRQAQIYCMPDHAHLFAGFRPTQSLADFMREVKSKTSGFINRENLTQEKFNWQEGYGTFSYSHSHVQNVIEYVLSQPEHHRKRIFKEEYLDFLTKFEIPYEEKYLFTWVEDSSTPAEPQQTT